MGLLDSLKDKADINKDGKLDKGDFDALNSDENKQKFEDAKKKADANGDGQVNFDDAKDAIAKAKQGFGK